MPVNPPTHEVTIGENVYYIKRFPPFLALEILGDLQKQFAGPLIAQLDGKEAPKNADGNVVLDAESANKMMQSFANLSNKLDGKTLREIAEKLLTENNVSVAINGDDPIKFNKQAQGLALENVADIITLCWEVLKFNYAEVIARLANPITAARQAIRM